MKIKIICEGKTEKMLKEALLRFVEDERNRQAVKADLPRVRIQFTPQNGGIPTGERFRKLVAALLDDPGVWVITLTDVYKGPKHSYQNAAHAKESLLKDAGKPDRFFAHAAQYDLEAWLLSYWGVIQARIGMNVNPWHANPGMINNDNPPAHRLSELYFRSSKTSRKSYKKTTEAKDILKGQDLRVAANLCSELKEFLNTILKCSGLQSLQ